MDSHPNETAEPVEQKGPMGRIDGPSPTAPQDGMTAQIQTEITDLRDEILGPIRSGECLEEFRLRSYQALRTADDVVRSNRLPSPMIEDSEDLEDDPILSDYFRSLSEINEAIHTES